MTLAPLAPVSALEVRLGVSVGSLAGLDLARIEACLDDVSALVREEAGVTWLGALDVVTAPASVLAVVYAAAIRFYLNPESIVSESVGSGAYSFSRSQDGLATLTETERATVRRAAAAAGSGRVFSIATPSAYSTVDEDAASV